METTRQQKVARLILKEIGELIIRDLAWVSPGSMVTATVVRVSPDLSFAKVYFSIFGKEPAATVMEKLEDNKTKIRYILGQKLRHQLRIVPELAFFHDDSAAYADRISQLLDRDDKDQPQP